VAPLKQGKSADMEIGDSVPTTEQEETKKPLKMKGGNVT